MATPSTPASIQRLISSRHGAALETVLLARLGTGVRHLANDFGGFRCDSAVNIVVFLVLSLRNTAGTVIQGASSTGDCTPKYRDKLPPILGGVARAFVATSSRTTWSASGMSSDIRLAIPRYAPSTSWGNSANLKILSILG